MMLLLGMIQPAAWHMGMSAAQMALQLMEMAGSVACRKERNYPGLERMVQILLQLTSLVLLLPLVWEFPMAEYNSAAVLSCHQQMVHQVEAGHRLALTYKILTKQLLGLNGLNSSDIIIIYTLKCIQCEQGKLQPSTFYDKIVKSQQTQIKFAGNMLNNLAITLQNFIGIF